MVERATAIADREGHERGVLVTGVAHLDGMVTLSDRVVRTYRPRPFRAPGVVDDDPQNAGGSEWTTGVPARLGTRAGAAVVDLVVCTLASLLGGVLAVLVHDAVAAVVGASWAGGAALLGTTLVGGSYFVLLETRWGQTVGKRAAGIVVTDDDGAPPAAWRALVRNLLRPVDFVVFYLLGVVVAGVTRDRQRLGDLFAGTVVREKVES